MQHFVVLETRKFHQSAAEMAQALRPFWSDRLANPYALASLLAATNPEQAGSWRQRSIFMKSTRDLGGQLPI